MLTSDPVQRFPHEREGVAMDVAAAAAAAAAAVVDWTRVHPSPSSYADVTDNVFPEEDDALSMTSTIDYSYTEEEYPSEDSDADVKDIEDEKKAIDDKDHGVEEEDSDEEQDSDEEEVHKDSKDEKKAIDDKDHEVEEDDLDEEEDDEEEVDGTESLAHPPGTDEAPKYTRISDSSDSDSDDDADSCDQSSWPEKCSWVASWGQNGDKEHLTSINVFAYYNKKEHYAGFGVIVRNTAAQPIMASSRFSPNVSADGNSFFYQVLMGIHVGVTLADKYAPFGADRYVRCNSNKVPGLLNYARCCSDSECKVNKKLCENCHQYLASSESCNMILLPLVRKLKHRNLSLAGIPRACNKAAYYLAKKARDEGRVGVQKKVKRTKKAKYECKQVVKQEIKPDDFPSELQDILWEDAFGMLLA